MYDYTNSKDIEMLNYMIEKQFDDEQKILFSTKILLSDIFPEEAANAIKTSKKTVENFIDKIEKANPNYSKEDAIKEFSLFMIAKNVKGDELFNILNEALLEKGNDPKAAGILNQEGLNEYIKIAEDVGFINPEKTLKI